MPNGNWVIMPNGVLSPGDTISVTRTNPHSNTPDTEKATRNLTMSLKGYRREIISLLAVCLRSLSEKFSARQNIHYSKKLAFH
jgi:hypothetical protein